MGVDIKPFLFSYIAIIEHIIHTELADQSKAVVLNYLESTSGDTIAEKARSAVYRYTEVKLPTVEEIRARHTGSKLNILDHLVLKMEYEADRLPPDTRLFHH